MKFLKMFYTFVTKSAKFTLSLLFLFIVLGVIIAACTGGNSSNSDSNTQVPNPPTAHSTPTYHKPTVAHPPAKDLNSLTLGYDGFWTTDHVNLTNRSSNTSDYEITADLLNSRGERVNTVDEWYFNVKPGQTVDEDGTLLQNGTSSQYHLSNIQVTRTASY